MNILVQKWLEALRSGKYKQGRDALTVGDTYCCLGVACDLFTPEEPRKLVRSPGIQAACVSYLDHEHYLPPSVQAELGLATDRGDFDVPILLDITDRFGEVRSHTVTSLAHANDLGATFEQIADLIESKPKWLFA